MKNRGKAVDWSSLGDPAPGELVAARESAHWALQWVAKAARANLPAAPDDSHTALAWDAELGGFARAMPEGIVVSLRLAPLELVLSGDGETRRLALDGRRPNAVDQWFDEALSARGLKHASQEVLPYEVESRPFQSTPELIALAGWFGAAAEVLEEVRAKHAALVPGPSPVRLWPHHFDIAVLVSLDEGGEEARSIGVGVSPGDAFYAQPYAYVSPWPAPAKPKLPALPPAAHWHTKDFFAAVATGEDLLAQPDPRAALVESIDAAFEAGRDWLEKKGPGSN